MDKVRPRTLATLALVIVSLLIITIDWRTSALVAVIAGLLAIANLRSAE